jgi:hypothetical protein
MAASERGSHGVGSPDLWRVVGIVLFAACLLVLVGTVARELRLTSFPSQESTHRKIRAAAQAFNLFAAVLLLAAALALRSAQHWSRRDHVVYRAAGVLGALITVIALYSAVDAQNTIGGEHGVPVLDRIASAAAGTSAALVGTSVVWLVFLLDRSERRSSTDA